MRAVGVAGLAGRVDDQAVVPLADVHDHPHRGAVGSGEIVHPIGGVADREGRAGDRRRAVAELGLRGGVAERGGGRDEVRVVQVAPAPGRHVGAEPPGTVRRAPRPGFRAGSRRRARGRVSPKRIARREQIVHRRVLRGRGGGVDDRGGGRRGHPLGDGAAEVLAEPHLGDRGRRALQRLRAVPAGQQVDGPLHLGVGRCRAPSAALFRAAPSG